MTCLIPSSRVVAEAVREEQLLNARRSQNSRTHPWILLLDVPSYARHVSDEPTPLSEVEAGQALEEILDLLRAGGHRVTNPRRLLIRSLLEAGGHRSAEQLAEEIQRDAPDVHISTIYRNLEELQRVGAIEHVHLGHGPATYHVVGAAHGHLVCSECGMILEVPGSLFGQLGDVLRDSYGFSIDPHHAALVGRCAECSAAHAADPAP